MPSAASGVRVRTLYQLPEVRGQTITTPSHHHIITTIRLPALDAGGEWLCLISDPPFVFGFSRVRAREHLGVHNFLGP
jgi:hypothetical protein